MKLDKRLHSLAAHWKSFCQNRTQDEWEKAEMEIAFYLCNHFCTPYRSFSTNCQWLRSIYCSWVTMAVYVVIYFGIMLYYRTLLPVMF